MNHYFRKRRSVVWVVIGLMVAQPTFGYVPNDTYFGKQDYLQRIEAPLAWDIVREHTQQHTVVIALLDTGVDIDHPDLSGNIWVNNGEVPGDGIDNDDNSYIDDVSGWDFLQSTPDPRPKIEGDYTFEAVNHGTVVAGIVAAVLNNENGIAGASYNAQIMPLRVLDDSGNGNTLILSQAIDYAVENGANIINLSLVGDLDDPRIEKSITRAYEAGVAIVAASGNQDISGVNLNDSPRYPVCEQVGISRIIGVAALDSSNKIALFSNFGARCIDIAAPGTMFYSTVWNRKDDPLFTEYYGSGWSGTSVAAPLVSATLALIHQVSPNITVADAYQSLLTGATSLESSIPNFQDAGAGMLNARRALEESLKISRRKPTNIVAAEGRGGAPRVSVYDKQGALLASFLAYAKGFRGGITLASGDIDGDGIDEIIVAPLGGGGPHIRIFDQIGRLKGQFFAYSSTYRGGVNLAVSDVNGDGKAEIITAPRATLEPLVKVFNATGSEIASWFAYNRSFKGGVVIAATHGSNGSTGSIVTAPASRGGPHVRIFDIAGNIRSQFMAYDESYRGGLTIAVGSFAQDRKDTIAVSKDVLTNVDVRLFSMNGIEQNRFAVYSDPDAIESPVRILAGDLTGDGRDDLVLYPRSTDTSLMLFDTYGRIIDRLNVLSKTQSNSTLQYSFAFVRGL